MLFAAHANQVYGDSQVLWGWYQELQNRQWWTNIGIVSSTSWTMFFSIICNLFCSLVNNSVISSCPRFLICRLLRKEMSSERKRYHENCLELIQFCIHLNLISRHSQQWFTLRCCISQPSRMPEIRGQSLGQWVNWKFVERNNMLHLLKLSERQCFIKPY